MASGGCIPLSLELLVNSRLDTSQQCAQVILRSFLKVYNFMCLTVARGMTLVVAQSDF